MSDFLSRPCTAFEGTRSLASGPLAEVALAVRAALAERPQGSFLTFGDTTGAVIDLDLRGSKADVLRRLRERAAGEEASRKPLSDKAKSAQARGRPKLGVVAREVTLLPRHWDWLAAQSGGASQTLRRLVDGARGVDSGKGQARAAREAAYRFMSAMAGNFPGFEEASRALFAGDRDRFAKHAAGWPADIGSYAAKLAEAGLSMAQTTDS